MIRCDTLHHLSRFQVRFNVPLRTQYGFFFEKRLSIDQILLDGRSDIGARCTRESVVHFDNGTYNIILQTHGAFPLN